MRDEDLRLLERKGNAGIAAAVVAFLLGGICLGGGDWPLCFTPFIAALGAVVGVEAALAKSLLRASLVGAAVFGLSAAIVAGVLDVSLYYCDHSYPFSNLMHYIAREPWFLAAFSSLGSITAYVGRSVGGVAAADGRPTRQFSLIQLMGLFIPVAIYLGYVAAYLGYLADLLLKYK
jgi:hypothetical protein